MALTSQIEIAARAGTGAISAGSADLGHAIALPAGDPKADAVERRESGKTVADRVLTHPCELDPDAGVTTCTHPGHAADAAEAREFLQALGLMPWHGVRRKSDRIGIDHRPTGRCPVCRRRQHIRMDLTVGVHGDCEGEGQRPLPEEASG